MLTRLIYAAVLCGLLLSPAMAQPNELNLRQDPPPAVQSERVTATYTGTAGATTYYYWVVTRYPVGFIVPTAPVAVGRAASSLGGGNSIALSWPAMAGASSYDVLRTTTPAAPSSCTCAVTLATTSTSVTDNGGGLSAWPPAGLTAAGSANASFILDNRNAQIPFMQMFVQGVRYYLGILGLGTPTNVPSGYIQLYQTAAGKLGCMNSAGVECLPNIVDGNLVVGTTVIMPTGVTAAQIQAVMDSLTEGGTVQISAGTYLTPTMLTVPANVVLRGSGRDTIIKAAPGFDFSANKAVMRIGSTAIAMGARIENLLVHGNDIANSVGVYSAWAEEQSGLAHVTVTHCKRYGIWWDGIQTQNSSMTDIDVQTTTGDASTVPIFIDGALSFRGIFGATIIGNTGVPVGLRINGLTSGSFDNIHMESVVIGIEVGSTVPSDGVVVSNVVGGVGITDLVKITTVTSRALLLFLTKNTATNAVNDVANGVTLTDLRVPYYNAGTGWTGPTRITTSNDNGAYFDDVDLLRLTNSSNNGGAVAGANFTVSAAGDVLGFNQSSNAIVTTYNASTVTKYLASRPSIVFRVTNQGSAGEGSTYEILTAPVGSNTLTSRLKITPTGEVVQKPPTSCSGLAAGTLWNDAGTPKICP